MNRTASAGGGSDKKSGSMHVTQMLLHPSVGVEYGRCEGARDVST